MNTQDPTVQLREALPELPEPWADTVHGWAFTAEQMRQYAIDALLSRLTGEGTSRGWRQLTSADEIRAACAAGESVEFTGSRTDRIDMPASDQAGSGGWIEHDPSAYEYDYGCLLRIGQFRSAPPAITPKE